MGSTPNCFLDTGSHLTLCADTGSTPIFSADTGSTPFLSQCSYGVNPQFRAVTGSQHKCCADTGSTHTFCADTGSSARVSGTFPRRLIAIYPYLNSLAWEDRRPVDASDGHARKPLTCRSSMFPRSFVARMCRHWQGRCTSNPTWSLSQMHLHWPFLM
jgi:hypothetical protein